MRSPATARRARRAFRSGSRGFTLVELMITVGIIVLIGSLSLVGIAAARNSARRTRVRDDLHMIEVALDQYRSDFQDYPRFPDPSSDLASMYARTQVGTGVWLDTVPTTDRGARLLCRALIAPGPAGTGQLANPGEDGADGPGFRIRRTAAGGFSANGAQLSGKIYGPYLDTNKFKLEYNQTLANMQDAKIVDYNGNPILYFVAQPGSPVLGPPTSSSSGISPLLPNLDGYFVGKLDPQNYIHNTSSATVKPFYNYFDNMVDTTTGKQLMNLADMQYLLGDVNNNGSIDTPGEKATTTQQYLLWTAGADGVYGRDKNGKTDDLANFDFPVGVRK